jgi:hypothetical protein
MGRRNADEVGRVTAYSDRKDVRRVRMKAMILALSVVASAGWAVGTPPGDEPTYTAIAQFEDV